MARPGIGGPSLVLLIPISGPAHHGISIPLPAFRTAQQPRPIGNRHAGAVLRNLRNTNPTPRSFYSNSAKLHQRSVPSKDTVMGTQPTGGNPSDFTGTSSFSGSGSRDRRLL